MAEALTYPGARWTPLGAQTESRMTSHDVICAHTMVGYLTSTDRYFRISNGPGFRGTESHFGVGGKWGPDLGGHLDGAVWQWQDLAFGADANLDGKGRVISFETADNAPARPEDIAPWTPAQLDGIVALCDWLCSPAAHAKCPSSWACHRSGIPRALIPDSKPGRRGLGYHAQGAAERVPGGEAWSTSPTKPCPAAARIRQFKTIVVPRVAALASGPPAPTDFLEEIMALYDTPAAFEAAVAKATAAGTNATFATWLPRAVAAMNGRANSLFPDAAVNDDDEQAALAATQQTNDLLAKLLEAQTPKTGA